MLNFHAVERAAVATTPFEFLTAGDLLNDDDLAAVQSDFPRIDKPGVFPLGSLEYGQAFAALIEDIRSRRMMDLLGRKFGIELADELLLECLGELITLEVLGLDLVFG